MVKLKDAILTHNAKIVSFDLFETILLRRLILNLGDFVSINLRSSCITADTQLNSVLPSKTILAMRTIAEVTARRKSCGEEVSLAEIYSYLPISREDQKTFLDMELKRQTTAIVFNPVVLNIVKEFIEENQPICFTSDIYLPRDFLLALLQSKIPSVSADQLLISSEERVTKGSGRLFNVLLARFSLTPDQVLHIGDHPIADVERPKSLGISTINIAPSAYSLKIERMRHQAGSTSGHLPEMLFAISRSARSYLHFKDNPKNEFFFEFGLLNLAPLLDAFSIWILSLATQLKIQKLLCITREGHLLKRLIDSKRSALINQGFKELEAISVDLFYSSRQATFLPSVCESSPEAILENVLSRVDITLRDVLLSLGLTPDNDEIIDGFDILSADFDRHMIGKISVRDWLCELLYSNWPEFLNRAREQRGLLNQYINDITGTSKFAFVDLGCNGTIFSQLAKCLNTPPEHYFHLYSSNLAYERLLGFGWLHSFVDSFSDRCGNVNIVARSAEVLETLINGLTPSTIAYKRSHNKAVLPVFETDISFKATCSVNAPLEDGEEARSSTEQGVFAALEAGIGAWMNAKEAIYEQLTDRPNPFVVVPQERLFCFEQFSRVVSNPTTEEANYIGQLSFGRNFGSLKTRPLVTAENVDAIRASGVFEILDRLDENFNFEKASLVWPAGAITQAFPKALSAGRFEGIRGGLSSSVIESLLLKLQPLRGQTVIVYGIGRVYQELKPHFKELNITVSAIIDRTAKQIRTPESDPKLFDISEYTFSSGENVIIASTGFVSEMRNNILDRSNGLEINIISF